MSREALLKLFAEIPPEVIIVVFGEYNTGCGDCTVCAWTGRKYIQPRDGKPFWADSWETIALRGLDNTIEKTHDFEEVLQRAKTAAQLKKKGELYDGK